MTTASGPTAWIGVGVEGLGHADADHRALQDERLAGGEAAAEREHHDAGEADANDEHPALAVAEDPRGFGGAMDVDDRGVGDEGGGDGRDEAGKLADDLPDDGGLVAGRGARRSAGDREYRAQHLRRPVVAGVEGAPAHIIGVRGLRERGAGDGEEGERQEDEPEGAHDSLAGFAGEAVIGGLRTALLYVLMEGAGAAREVASADCDAAEGGLNGVDGAMEQLGGLLRQVVHHAFAVASRRRAVGGFADLGVHLLEFGAEVSCIGRRAMTCSMPTRSWP